MNVTLTKEEIAAILNALWGGNSTDSLGWALRDKFERLSNEGKGRNSSS